MKSTYLSFLLVLFLASCRTELSSVDIEMNQGFYVLKESGEKLNGKYLLKDTVEGISCKGSFHETEEEYKEGIPINNWLNKFNGDLIHKGQYLKEPKIQDMISDLTKSQRVDLNYWQEGDYFYLTVNLVNNKIEITEDLNAQIESISKKELFPHYPFKDFDVNSNI